MVGVLTFFGLSTMGRNFYSWYMVVAIGIFLSVNTFMILNFLIALKWGEEADSITKEDTN